MGLLNLIHKVKLNKLLSELTRNPKKILDPKFAAALWNEFWSVKEIREMLKGYKTYIVAALMAVATLAHSLGYIDDATFEMIKQLLAAGAIGTVAAKLNRMGGLIK